MSRTAIVLASLAAVSLACSSSEGPVTVPDAGKDAPGDASHTPTPATFLVGAASVDITPPKVGAAPPPSGFSACDPATYTGKRTFAFEEPYVDGAKKGRYADGDKYCDANGNGRYDGIFLAGGGGSDRQPTEVHDPLGAQAIVFESHDGSQRVAMIVVDSIGLPSNETQAIAEAATKASPSIHQVLVSSTHDESAPDALGLWGPTDTTSGVNDYYMAFVAAQAASALAHAVKGAVPARLRFVEAAQPASFDTTFSSFPFVFDPAVMAMQAVAVSSSSDVLFTLANYGFHAEGYGYSTDPALAVEVSADWPGALRKALEAKYGGVGVGVAGLLGSIETPGVYPGSKVSTVPGKPFSAGNDNDFIFPEPKSARLPPGSEAETNGIGQAMATSVIDAFESTPGQWSVAGDVRVATVPFCVAVENTNFLLAATFGLFKRPISCMGHGGSTPTTVAAFDLGDAQLLYLPGEVFPFTVLRGFLGAEDMPFPSEPMTPWVASAMTRPFPFFVGLGTDMLGYLMPPDDFVGEPGEVKAEPWNSWDVKHTNEDDRFGWIHNDDGESIGPNAAMDMSTAALQALQSLDPQGAPNTSVMNGRFVDADGHVSRSPFPSSGFSGAIGVWVLPKGASSFTGDNGSLYLVPGHDKAGGRAASAAAGGFLDAHGQPQAGYDVATRGVWLVPKSGEGTNTRIFADTFTGQ